MNPDSEQILNRFASGDLSVAEESDFLAYCEIEPERYRKATLAVAEHRRMSEALLAFALPEQSGESEVPPAPSERSLGEQPKRNHSRLVGTCFAVAALLAGVAIGWGFADFGVQENVGGRGGEFAFENDNPGTGMGRIEESPQLKVSDEELPPELGFPSPDRSLVAMDNVIESPRPSLASAVAEIVTKVKARPVFSDESRNRLRQSGWEVEEEPLIYVFGTDDGEQFAVPTRNMNIRFVNDKK